VNEQAFERVSTMHRDQNGPGNQARGRRGSALLALGFLILPASAWAGETDLIIPDMSGNPLLHHLLLGGCILCLLGLAFGLYEYLAIRKFNAHASMLAVSATIYETCKTYLLQQGKFLAVLEAFVATCVAFYFGYLRHYGLGGVLTILAFSLVGISGSCSVAWFGIRINTLANSRMAFASLQRKPLKLLDIPIRAGMSIGVVLVSLELLIMLGILLLVPRAWAGASFLGFAIGESLGASALRIGGGIFTKIADIGSDLMKIVFSIKEDDPRNPGVIADCVGDNAGDSVGPTADGFETYGVTGVALITFIVLAVSPERQVSLLGWIFAMRILMIAVSVGSYWLNRGLSVLRYGGREDFDFEEPLTTLIWITSAFSIAATFAASWWLLRDLPKESWLWLSIIISCGTLGAALIPEVTKAFTSAKSRHTQEVVVASREGGASLTILSGLVAGNFSAFWIGGVIAGLMLLAYLAGLNSLGDMMTYPSVFAWGLVAFGFLGMGPVTIAVDSYGPVTDNAQSVYELSQIESLPNIKYEIEHAFGFTPDFEKAKLYLEENDSAGNTFKATAKPVLIGTAVVGATTMIFSLILLLQKTLQVPPETLLNLLNPYSLLGLICGGAVIYWFTGASTQAVTTGAYRAVEYIKKHIRIDEDSGPASIEHSKEVVRICTQYAQEGMYNIFLAIFSFSRPCDRIRRWPSSSATWSASPSSDCSKRCSWPTPADAGTTPRKWWK
jgi:K(+)-stimulated pyrophosphate-energized sodium pump